MSKVTVREAAKLTGKSRETINTSTRDGILSYELNARNHKVIDIAELERVYPLVKTMAEIKQESLAVRGSPKASEPDSNTELAVLQEKLVHSELVKDMIVAERERERRQLESEIENLRARLEKSQEQHDRALLLITDQSKQTRERGGGDAAKHPNNSDGRTASQAEVAKIVKKAKREAFEDMKNKPWWRVVVR